MTESRVNKVSARPDYQVKVLGEPGSMSFFPRGGAPSAGPALHEPVSEAATRGSFPSTKDVVAKPQDPTA